MVGDEVGGKERERERGGGSESEREREREKERERERKRDEERACTGHYSFNVKVRHNGMPHA